jgi:hypothetical protein
MSNVFKEIRENTSSFILFAWPLGCFLIALSVVLMIEDYETSRMGYIALPTAKVHDGWVTFAVAFLPQAGQIVLFYIFGKNTKKGWAALVAILFFLTDIGTDAWFKSTGNWDLMPLAIVESLFIFTLGSEVLFTIAFGFVMESLPVFMASLGNWFNLLRIGFSAFLGSLGMFEEKEEYSNNKNFRQ